METLDLIRKVDFFSKLTEKDLSAISCYFEEVHYPKDSVIFEENTCGDSFFIIKQGQVEIIKRIEEHGSTEAELRMFEPYDYFGEMSLIDDYPRSATAKAYTDCILIRLSKDNFMQICLEHTTIIFSLIRTVSTRLRATNQRFVEIVDSLLKKSRMAAIGTAASKIVHDVKTPITVMILTADLISKLFPETTTFTEKIVKQAKSLDEMIREILDFARGEQSVLEMGEHDIDRFWEDATESYLPIAEQKEINIVFSNSMKNTVYFDAPRVKRVILNLVKNAVEAIPEKSTIQIQSFEEKNHWHVVIADNGPGIPEEIIDHLFEPFVTKGKKNGTGLGLAISQKLILDHKGSIGVTNQKDGGARFDITLPVNPFKLEK